VNKDTKEYPESSEENEKLSSKSLNETKEDDDSPALINSYSQ